MTEVLWIAMEAHNAERNHHRRYEVAVCRDLLGDLTATVSFGRAGERLRIQRFSMPDDEELQRMVLERLSRRLSAERRIFCRYEIAGWWLAAVEDRANWLPSVWIEATREFDGHLSSGPSGGPPAGIQEDGSRLTAT